MQRPRALACLFSFIALAGCSSDHQGKHAEDILRAILPSNRPSKENLNREPLLNLTGFWISMTDPHDVILISSEFNVSTSKFTTLLFGFDVESYTGSPTTMWCRGAESNFSHADCPPLNAKSPTEATATITTSNSKAEAVDVQLDLKLIDPDTLKITHASAVDTQSVVSSFYKSARDFDKAQLMYLSKARLQARKIANFYANTKDKTRCVGALGLNWAIQNNDETCVKEFIETGVKPSLNDLDQAIQQKDYRIVSYLLDFFMGAEIATSSILSNAAGSSLLGEKKFKNGKPFSFDLESAEILRLILKKEDLNKYPEAEIKQFLPILLSHVGTMLDGDSLLETIFNQFNDKEMIRQILNDKKAPLCSAIIDYFYHNKAQNLNIVDLLLRYGADPHQSYGDGSGSVAELGLKYGDYRLFKLLRQRGTKFSRHGVSLLRERLERIKKELASPSLTWQQRMTRRDLIFDMKLMVKDLRN